MKLPENCLRGIPNKNFLKKSGYPNVQLFSFQDKNARDDGWIAESINWQDDDMAIQFTLSQEKEKTPGEVQFKAGVAIIPLYDIDKLSKLPSVNGALCYERDPLPGNCYHGNILLRSDTIKSDKRSIVEALALYVSEVIPQPES